jgi:hypothetical protein
MDDEDCIVVGLAPEDEAEATVDSLWQYTAHQEVLWPVGVGFRDPLVLGPYPCHHTQPVSLFKGNWMT